MFELVDLLEPVIWLAELQINDVNLVVHRVGVITSHCHLEFVILPGPEGYRIVLKVTFIGIYFLS